MKNYDNVFDCSKENSPEGVDTVIVRLWIVARWKFKWEIVATIEVIMLFFKQIV